MTSARFLNEKVLSECFWNHKQHMIVRFPVGILPPKFGVDFVTLEIEKYLSFFLLALRKKEAAVVGDDSKVRSSEVSKLDIEEGSEVNDGDDLHGVRMICSISQLGEVGSGLGLTGLTQRSYGAGDCCWRKYQIIILLKLRMNTHVPQCPSYVVVALSRDVSHIYRNIYNLKKDHWLEDK